jgi:hypothetical protein
VQQLVVAAVVDIRVMHILGYRQKIVSYGANMAHLDESSPLVHLWPPRLVTCSNAAAIYNRRRCISYVAQLPHLDDSSPLVQMLRLDNSSIAASTWQELPFQEVPGTAAQVMQHLDDKSTYALPLRQLPTRAPVAAMAQAESAASCG